MIKDIYTIERRADFHETCVRIDKYVSNIRIEYDRSEFYKLVNREIKHYSKNCGALDLYDYFDDIGVDLDTITSSNYRHSDDVYLLYIQSIIAFTAFLINWLGRNDMTLKKSLFEWSKPLLEMIDYRLELLNYKRYYNEQKDEHQIIKRDVNVDSVIDLINDRDVQVLLLQYLDFKTAKDLDSKKFILSNLFKYYEDPNNNLKTSNNSSKSIVKLNSSSKNILPIEAFSEICQAFDVRHYPEAIKNNPDLVRLDDKDTHVLCDIAFYMFIEAIRIPEIHDFRLVLSHYKKVYKIDDSF